MSRDDIQAEATIHFLVFAGNNESRRGSLSRSAFTVFTYYYDDAENRVQETTGGATTFYLTDTVNPTGWLRLAD
jgi:hypothetical protein